MPPRTVKRLLALVTALSMSATLALPAGAQPDPPFELRFPQDTTRTRFHNDWRARRSGGRRHTGTDLMADHKMVEVYAVADGVVSKVNERRRPGRYLIIEHEGGWDSLYIHLNDDNLGTDDGQAPWSLTLAPGVEEGATVRAGQVIGWAGDSGNAETATPHTHFELHHNSREINPFHLLTIAFERDHAILVGTQSLLRAQTVGSISIV